MARYYDSHSHLFDCKKNLNNDAFVQHIKQLKKIGITVVSVAYDLPSAIRLAKIELPYSFGIHPLKTGELTNFKKFKTSNLVAIGECGLDNTGTKNVAQQISSFRAHLKIGIVEDLPVIVHCRGHNELMLAQLSHAPGDQRGVWHCFTGSYGDFMALPNNYYIGINPIAFRPQNHRLRETISKIPMSRLVVETDWPYVRRGDRVYHNYIDALKSTYLNIGKLKNIKINRVLEIMEQNFKKLFKI